MQEIFAAAQRLAMGGTLPIEPVQDTQWQQDRIGKFTASRIADLCTTDRKGEGLGKTALAYIHEVLAERLGDMEENFPTKEMQYGKDNEAAAAAIISEKYKGFQYFADVFFPMPENEKIAGASPDFLIDGKIVGDIKIPYTTRKYIEFIQHLYSPESFKAYSKQYYYQLQMQMICTNTNTAMIAVFNPKFIGTENESIAIRTLMIAKDAEVVEEILKAIAGAEMRLNLLKSAIGLVA